MENVPSPNRPPTAIHIQPVINESNIAHNKFHQKFPINISCKYILHFK